MAAQTVKYGYKFVRPHKYRVKTGVEMTPSLLAELINEHKNEVTNRLSWLENAYLGDYQIFHAPPKPKWKPDNRVAAGFAKYISDVFNGFFCGIPIKITSDDENVNEYLQYLSNYNSLDDEHSELAKNSSNFGRANEIYYIDEEAQICISEVSPMESFMVTDDSILERPMFFVRYYLDDDKVLRGSWSNDEIVQHFYQRGGKYVWEGEPKEHGFPGVPATEFDENAERLGIYEGDKLSLINEFNKTLSEKSNDVDYFADAYMKILGPKLTQAELSYLRSNRIINLEQSDISGVDISFLQKPDADGTQEHLLDRLYKLIFQTAMVSDISDESFGSASGVALKYKMEAEQKLASTKANKFTAAFNRRYKLIFGHPLSRMDPKAWVGIDYKFTQNYPANVADEATTARNLEGIVSKETQLKVLSIVEDPKKEAEDLKSDNLLSSMTAEFANGTAE